MGLGIVLPSKRGVLVETISGLRVWGLKGEGGGKGLGFRVTLNPLKGKALKP